MRLEQKLYTMRAAADALRLAANLQLRDLFQHRKDAFSIAINHSHYLEWTSSLLILFRETLAAN